MTTTLTDDSKTAVLLTKKNGTQVIFQQGDFVSFDMREDGVKILEIIGRNDDNGPVGFEYLPWRESEQRWATPIFSISRPPRFIVCYPYGNSTYGQHINWESFHIVDGKCPKMTI